LDGSRFLLSFFLSSFLAHKKEGICGEHPCDYGKGLRSLHPHLRKESLCTWLQQSLNSLGDLNEQSMILIVLVSQKAFMTVRYASLQAAISFAGP
jgi:hypothetical protein